MSPVITTDDRKGESQMAATVHNPTNFDPSQYEIVGYRDNQRPRFYPPYGATGESMQALVAQYQREVAAFEADLQRLLGDDWRHKSHRCIHCGNANVRWITIARHLATGEHVVFGADCTERLAFANFDEFQIARLKRLADATAAKLKVAIKAREYADEHPEIAQAEAALQLPVHARNSFVRDLLSKLNHYGFLTTKQLDAIGPSLNRDVEYERQRAVREAEPKAPAPRGKAITIEGQVIKGKWHTSDYGDTFKVTIKVNTAAGVWMAWGTLPTGVNVDEVVGKRLRLVANIERGSDTDPSFVFFSRPRLAQIVSA